MSTSGSSWPPRDLVGYGRTSPQVPLPNGARIAVNIVVNYEEGAELSPYYGDAERETFGEATYPIPLHERDLALESLYEYGSRVGIWRVMNALEERSLTGTVFASAAAFERYPEIARSLAATGMDFVAHGYRWEAHFGKDEQSERADIRRSVETIERTTGQRPVGWFTRYASSLNTRRLLQQEGFLYDSTSYSDDVPYWDFIDGAPFLVVPYTIDVNDIRFWRGSLATANDFEAYIRDAFDVLYDEGGATPRMLSIGLHPRIIGRPARFAGLLRSLDYMLSKPDVWFCRRTDYASHWAESSPPPSLTPGTSGEPG